MTQEVPQVSLLTCGPGADIYELEGHTALRVRWRGSDMTVNYGVFDFDSPGFVYRFVKGETDYLCAATTTERFLNSYRYQGREVWEQPVALDSVDATRIVGLLYDNLRPENRVYRYNYILDNCATRPLAIIERARADSITGLRAPEITRGWTFRDAMRHYHRDYPWYQFGIDLALGSGLDRPMTEREKTFVPLLLMPMTLEAGVAGEPVMIIPRRLGPTPTTPWWATPMAAGIYVLVFAVVITAADIRRRRISRWADALLFGIYGLAGCLLAFLVFISTHEATSPNWLLAWLNPLCLLVPALIYIKSCRKLVKCYEFANFAIMILLALLWPWLGQSGNPAFIPFAAADLLLSARYLYITICYHSTTRV